MQAVADLGLVGAHVVQARQLREALEPEDALEERRRAVADGAGGTVAPGFRDQSALEEIRDRGVGGDADEIRNRLYAVAEKRSA